MLVSRGIFEVPLTAGKRYTDEEVRVEPGGGFGSGAGADFVRHRGSAAKPETKVRSLSASPACLDESEARWVLYSEVRQRT